MSGTSKRQPDEAGGIDVTTAVEGHGNRRSRSDHHHAAPGDDEWRDDEGPRPTRRRTPAARWGRGGTICNPSAPFTLPCL